MEYLYFAKFEPDPDGGFLVTFPDVPEAITHGSTHDEAIRNAAEALGALRGYLAENRPLPRPSARTGIPIPVMPADAMKLAVIEAFRSEGITKTELARRIGKRETEARRILDPDHPSKVETLQEALTSMRKSLVISVRNVA